jgi:hypothetical protein
MRSARLCRLLISSDLVRSGHIVYTRRMPWMETNGWTSGGSLSRTSQSGHWSMTELCERYGVSRPSGYKWLARYRAGGDTGLRQQLRASPLSASNRR